MGLIVAVAATLGLASTASASGEVAATQVTLNPNKGSFYKGGNVPAEFQMSGTITAPFPANPQVLPIKQIALKLPEGTKFNAATSNTPVCPDSKIGPNVNLSISPSAAAALCPKSVIGNGTAELYLARNNSAAGPTLKDPVLIAFNGGKTSTGQSLIKIYGYSQLTNYGVYITAIPDGDTLNVIVPRLSFDSAVGHLQLNIPGTNNADPALRGKDPNYVTARCSTGTLLSSATFTLGTRDDSGNPSSPDSTVSSPETSQPCTGKAGAPPAAFANLKVKGPKSVKKGKKGTFKVTIKNTGVGAGKATVTVSGKGVKGKASAGNIAPGASKTVKVKVKFTKKGTAKAKFKVAAKGAKAKTKVLKVKVK